MASTLFKPVGVFGWPPPHAMIWPAAAETVNGSVQPSAPRMNPIANATSLRQVRSPAFRRPTLGSLAILANRKAIPPEGGTPNPPRYCDALFTNLFIFWFGFSGTDSGRRSSIPIRVVQQRGVTLGAIVWFDREQDPIERMALLFSLRT